MPKIQNYSSFVQRFFLLLFCKLRKRKEYNAEGILSINRRSVNDFEPWERIQTTQAILNYPLVCQSVSSFLTSRTECELIQTFDNTAILWNQHVGAVRGKNIWHPVSRHGIIILENKFLFLCDSSFLNCEKKFFKPFFFLLENFFFWGFFFFKFFSFLFLTN